MEKRNCELCKKIFELRQKNQIGRFCSSLCNRKVLRKSQSDKWKAYLAVETEEQKKALLKARFDKNVIRKKDGCWNFKILRTKKGYGRFTFRGKVFSAHRVSWVLYNGIIPDKQMVLHKCNNRQCVNPDHLYLGNHKDNMQDKANRFLRSVRRKLSDKQVYEVRDLLKLGIPLRQIGRKYNITDTAIAMMRKKKTYKYVI